MASPGGSEVKRAKISVVTLDGPAGSGKSSAARRAAEKLGWRYLDTGAMYRAVTWYFLQEGVDPNDSGQVARALERLDLSLDEEGRVRGGGKILGEAELRDPKVEEAIKVVADSPQVRRKLRALQRKEAEKGPLVAEGRDMGSVVFPDGAFKFYLDASPEVRARRRWEDFRKQGKEISLEEVRAGLEARDKADRERKDGALVRPPDAVLLDTTNLSLQEVVDQVVERVRQGLERKNEEEDAELPKDPLHVVRPLYFIGWYLTKSFLSTYLDFKVEGDWHIPSRGGVLLVSNHQSHLDPPILGSITRRPVHFLARRTLTQSRFMRFVFWFCGIVPVERDGRDLKSFRAALDLLQRGEVVGLFPEGTRTHDGKVQAFKRGSELLARKAGVPIVPVGIAGAFQVWPRHRKLPRRGNVRVQVGRPIPPEVLARPDFDLRAQVVRLVEEGEKKRRRGAFPVIPG